VSDEAFKKWLNRQGVVTRRVIELTYVVDVISPTSASDDQVEAAVFTALILNPDSVILMANGSGQGHAMKAIVEKVNLRLKEVMK